MFSSKIKSAWVLCPIIFALSALSLAIWAAMSLLSVSLPLSPLITYELYNFSLRSLRVDSVKKGYILVRWGVNTYLSLYFSFSSSDSALSIFCDAASEAAETTASDKPSKSALFKINSNPFVSASRFCPNSVDSSEIFEFISVICFFCDSSNKAPLRTNCILVSFKSFCCSLVKSSFSLLFHISSTLLNKSLLSTILS